MHDLFSDTLSHPNIFNLCEFIVFVYFKPLLIILSNPNSLFLSLPNAVTLWQWFCFLFTHSLRLCHFLYLYVTVTFFLLNDLSFFEPHTVCVFHFLNLAFAVY